MAESRPLFDVLGAEYLLRGLWPAVAALVNAPESRPGDPFYKAWTDNRRSLEALLDGRPPLENNSEAEVVQAPLSLVQMGNGRVKWAFQRIDAQNALMSDDMEGLESQYRFVVTLLGLPELTGLLRRCETCRKFYLVKRAHLRAKFCSKECRFAFHRKRRSKAAQAEYMRKYRADIAERKRRRRRREVSATKGGTQ